MVALSLSSWAILALRFLISWSLASSCSLRIALETLSGSDMLMELLSLAMTPESFGEDDTLIVSLADLKLGCDPLVVIDLVAELLASLGCGE